MTGHVRCSRFSSWVVSEPSPIVGIAPSDTERVLLGRGRPCTGYDQRTGRAFHMNLQRPENVWMGTSVEDERVIERINLLRDCNAETLFISFEPLIGPIAEPDLTGYDWAIVGGESGPNHRKMPHKWVWQIKDSCREHDVAFFFKQSSAYHSETGQYLQCRDGSERLYKEMPDIPDVTSQARDDHSQLSLIETA